MLQIETIPCGPLETNCYILFQAKEAVVIDPAAWDAPHDFLCRNGLMVTHILLTHGHFDHIGGVCALKEETGAPVYIHAADASMLSDDSKNFSIFAGSAVKKCAADRILYGGETIRALETEIEALHTPGHTPGGVCYLLRKNGVLFTGDTLFRLSIGRSDFPGSVEADLMRSIREKIFALSDDYTLYPGHMRASTLSFEKAHNPFIHG